ncbi:hypothetical protein BDV96DRAFT_485240 [Lophiotrema nucula]|uniref:UBC core domain-containing protein n=1 Tax=Lophiotrema nucula TaxID=690887 RepID=A0A6A5ZPF9_9PLEO|nr:hypothetical protein BDV96DRAFT_485240 [Lophiotrema nucula]
MILQDLLNSRPTELVSLAPIGTNLLQLLGRIQGPPVTPYEAGIFHVQIPIPEDFPIAPPACRFLTKVYHPNIDATGKMCLECLHTANWRMELMHLESILISTSALLDQPGMDDPLVPDIAGTYIQDKATFDHIARQYTFRYA